MVVIWSKPAIDDLKNYLEHSKMITEGKVQKYIESLVDYGNSLESNPNLGKEFLTYKNITIRQLLYKMHRIFYYVDNDEIIIIQIKHTLRNIDYVIEIIKNLIGKDMY